MRRVGAILRGLLIIVPSFLFSQNLPQGDTSQAKQTSNFNYTEQTAFTAHFLSRSFISSLPFRGVRNYFSLIPGVVDQNGNLYVRGSRAGEVAYLVEGISVTNRFFNSEGVSVIPEAIEEIGLYTGVSPAELSGANGGFVNTRMRTGGEELDYSFNVETDNFVSTGSEFLSTTGFGYRNIVGTVGGPLPYGIKFFLAGELHYMRNRQPMFLEPMKFEKLVTDARGSWPAGTPLPGSLEFKRNYFPNNWGLRNTLQGNLLAEVTPKIKLHLTGSYAFEKSPQGSNWPAVLENYFRQRRNMLNQTRTLFGSLHASHALSPKISYQLGLSFYNRSSDLSDPDFGDNWQLYADSAANAEKGYSGFTSRYRGPSSYSTIFMFLFNHPNSPNTRYTKNRQSNLSAYIDFAAGLRDDWEIKAGIAVELWKMRLYSIRYIPSAMEFLNGTYGSSPRKFSSELERRIYLARYANIDFYGYDVDGNKVDVGLDAPRKPRFFSSYLQNNILSQDLKLSLGIRYDVYDLRTPMPQDIEKPPVDYWFNWLDESKFIEQKAMSVLLPRVNASFKLSENTSASVAYGRFAQLPSLETLFLSPVGLNSIVNPFFRSGYVYLIGLIPGYFLKPEKSTQYEVALKHEVVPGVAMSIGVYYKALIDQAQLAFHDTTVALPWLVVYKNDGAGNVKGIELTLTYQRLKRFAATFYYTVCQARGKGSYPRSNAGLVEYYFYHPWYPEFDSPLDYDQTHRGTLLADYRFQPEDGSFLDGTRITLLLTFNSGHRYSKEEEIRNLGSTTPWQIGVRSVRDPRLVQPAEPPNSSTTPWVWNFDVRVSKKFHLGSFGAEAYVNVLNVLNTRHILNVYPTTGRPDDDSWLRNRIYQEVFSSIPGYEEFYRTINLQNRWAYMGATGNDIYGSPRQIRLGVRFER